MVGDQDIVDQHHFLLVFVEFEVGVPVLLGAIEQSQDLACVRQVGFPSARIPLKLLDLLDSLPIDVHRL